MSRKIRTSDLPEFDLAEHLKTTDDIAAYLTMVMDDGDASEFAHALGVAARAKGMSEVARAAGMTREGLYKALRSDAQPRFETVLKVCKALGVHLHAEGDGSAAA